MAFIIAISVFSLDQFSKYLIRQNLTLRESVPVLKNIFHLTLVYNKGAAFGILQNGTIVFVVAALVAIFIIVFNLSGSRAKKIKPVYNVALGLVLGGIIGNLFDRVFLGYVVDFIDFRIWPVFNIADSAITIGTLLLGFLILSSEKQAVKIKKKV